MQEEQEKNISLEEEAKQVGFKIMPPTIDELFKC
jgi:hypothetical protein